MMAMGMPSSEELDDRRPAGGHTNKAHVGGFEHPEQHSFHMQTLKE